MAGRSGFNPYGDWQAEPEGASALDVAKEATAGALEVPAQVATSAQYALSQADKPNAAAFARGAGEMLHGASDYLRGSETEGGRRAAGAGFIPEPGQASVTEAPASTLAMKTAGMAPYLALMMAFPESAIGSAVAGSGLNAAQTIDAAMSATNQFNDKDLQAQSPTYAHLRESMDENQARAELAKIQYTGKDAAIAGLNGALTTGMMARVLKGANAAPSAIKGAGIGALEAGVGMGAQAANTQYAGEQSQVAAGMQPEVNWHHVMMSGLEGAITGGITGAGFGAFHGASQGTIKPVSEVGPDDAQAEALKPDVAGAMSRVGAYQDTVGVQAPNVQDAMARVLSAQQAPEAANSNTPIRPPQQYIHEPSDITEMVGAEKPGYGGMPRTKMSAPEAANDAAPILEGTRQLPPGLQRVMDAQRNVEAAQTEPETPRQLTGPKTGEAEAPPAQADEPLVKYNPETGRVKVGGWEFSLSSRDAIAVKKPGGDWVNYYDRDQRKHYGRQGEAYLEEATKNGIPEVVQPILRSYLKDKLTPEQFIERLNAKPTKSESPAKVTPKEVGETVGRAAQRIRDISSELPSEESVRENLDNAAADARNIAGFREAPKRTPEEDYAHDLKLFGKKRADKLHNREPSVEDRGPRILRSTTEEGIARDNAAGETTNDQIASNIENMNKPVVDEETKPSVTPGEFKTKDKKRAEKRIANGEAAKSIMDAHPPTDKETAGGGRGYMTAAGRSSMLARAHAILNAAKEGGVTVPSFIRNHVAAEAFLKEAKNLVSRVQKQNKLEYYHDFAANEFDLREGPEGFERYKEKTRTEGEARNSIKLDEHETISDVVNEPKPTVTLKGDEVTAFKNKADEVGTKIKVETKKKRTIKPPVKEPSYLDHGDTITGVGANYGQEAEVESSHRLSDVLHPSMYRRTGIAGQIMPHVAKRIGDVIGNMEVHFVTPENMKKLTGRNPLGYYDEVQNHIVISHAAGKEGLNHVLLHEAVHGAIWHELEANPRLKAGIKEVMKIAQLHPTLAKRMVKETDYTASTKPLKEHYGLIKNEHEFISEALSNPMFQREMSNIRIPESLAQQLGVPKFKAHTLWQCFVAKIRRALRLPPHAHTALEAALATVDRLTVDRSAEGRENKLLHDIAALDHTPFLEMPEGVTNAGNKARDALARVGLKGMLRHAGDKLSSFGMLARRGDEFFGGEEHNALRRAQEFREMMRVEKNKILEKEGGSEIVDNLARLEREHSKEDWQEAVRIAYDSTLHNINPWEGEEQFVGNSRKDIQRKKAQEQLSADYDALPEDLQSGIRDAAEFFKKQQNTRALETIKSLLDTAGHNEPGLAEKIFKDELDAEALKEKFGNNAFIKALNAATELKEIKGAYFPMRRYGDYVVNARREISVPHDAVRVKGTDDTIQFTSTGDNKELRSKVEKYLGGTDDRALSIKDVWVDKNDPQKIVPSDDLDGVKATRIRLHTQITDFAESEHAALKKQAEYQADPRLSVKGVELRRLNPNARNSDLMSSQMASIIKHLENKDSVRGLSDQARADLIQTLEESTIRMRAGNRIQGTQLQRRNIEGYSKDLTRATAEYADMSAGYLARLRHMPKAEAALDEARKYAEERRFESSDRTLRRSELLREAEDRLYGINDQIETGRLNHVTRRLLQASMLDKLGGISFHIINSMEPWMTAAPVMYGKHKASDVVTTMGNVYSLLGAHKMLGAGLKDTAKAMRESHGFTDYISEFKKNIAANDKAHAKAYSEVLDYLHDRGVLDKEAEFEVRFISHPEESKVGRALDRADLMSRQVGTAIESINRAVTGIAAYRLEVKRTGDHEKALRYAYDVVHDSMGNYAKSNAAPIFNHPIGRVALQFRKFGQKMYYLLGKTFRGMLAGDKEAAKQFAGVMFTHGVMAGMLGLPLEPIKAALIGANALGLTDYNYEDFQQLVRSTAMQLTGSKGLSEVIAHGLPRAAGVDLSSRVGLDSLVMHGQPRSDKQNDLKAWLFETMAGAPASLVLQQIDGMKALMGGDIVGASKAVPVKALHDIMSSYQGATEGKKTNRGYEAMSGYGVKEALLKGIGLKPEREAETQEMRAMNYGETTRQKAQRDEMIKLWATAKPADRHKLWGRIESWNASRPADARLTHAQLEQELKRRATNESKGRIAYGQQVNKFNKYIVDRNRSVYNVQ